ncbi:MAG TPA: AAA family ATPase, partial [Acidimicrobiales bacterium]|nr:AAA family ATPase [Acidimicrobiales bacterium]
MDPDWPSIPRLPRLLLERPQLDRRLDSWAPVTVVRGPQGYGKTVLVASWLDRRRGPDVVPVWVAATPGMGDPTRFWAELRRQLAGAGLVQGDPAANRPAAELSVDVPPGCRVVVVVDNFQHICQPAVLDQLLELVESHRRLHLVVCYRAWHPVQSLAQAAVGVEVVRPGDLLLSTGEITALAAARGEALSPEAAERVRDAVGGWLAAVRLVLDASDGDGDDLSVAEEYLRATVLPAIDSTSGLEDLMRFSLARRLDQDLVKELCDDPVPDRYLQRLESSGLLERHPSGDRVDLVLPAVIAKILRESYAGRRPDQALAFHRRLSTWYAARRDPDDALLALLHAVDGEDWDQAKRMWILHGPTLRMRAPEVFRQALDAMPDQVLSSHPAMLIDRMVANVVDDDSDLDGRMATIGAYFRSSTQVVNRRLDALPAADLVYLGTGHLVGLRMLGHLDDSDRFAEGLDRRTGAFPELTRAPSDGLGWFHLQWGLTRTLLGDDRAVDAYRRSWDYGNRVPSNWIPANAAANLALTYAVDGDTGQAERWLDRYRWFETSEQWAHYLVGIGAHLADGLLALDRL